MVNNVSLVGDVGQTGLAAGSSTSSRKAASTVSKASDILDLSAGKSANNTDVLDLVRNKAYEKLRAVVGDARTALGLSADETLDTSPEATADRIVNFALRYFSKYAENNNLANDEEGRRQYAEFIGGAIGQGIQEARDILSGLQVLSSDTSSLIDNTASIIQQRLDDFITNGL